MHPWFGADGAHAFSYLSLLSLAAGLQVFVNRGRYRALVTSVLTAGAALGAALLVLAAIAVWTGQPRYILLALGVTGGVSSAVFGGVLLTLRRQYTVAELRRMAAKDL